MSKLDGSHVTVIVGLLVAGLTIVSGIGIHDYYSNEQYRRDNSVLESQASDDRNTIADLRNKMEKLTETYNARVDQLVLFCHR